MTRTVNGSCFSSSVFKQLKKNGELRIESFSKERVAELTNQIDEFYEEGLGISGINLCNLIYGYAQPLSKYEGIVYYALGLIVTRPNNKKGAGTLFFVRKEDAGKTFFPVQDSVYHDYVKYNSLRDVVDSSFSEETSSSSSQVWSPSVDEVEESEFCSDSSESTVGSTSVINSKLSSILSTLSKVCSSLSSIVSTIK